MFHLLLSTMFTYVIMFFVWCFVELPHECQDPQSQKNMCWGKSGIFAIPIGAQVIICHMTWQFLMGGLWFKNTNVDPGRPCMLLLPLSPAFCLVFSLQIPPFTPTDKHTAPPLVIVNRLEFFQMCTDMCIVHVGWAAEGVFTQTIV